MNLAFLILPLTHKLTYNEVSIIRSRVLFFRTAISSVSITLEKSTRKITAKENIFYFTKEKSE